MNKNFPQKLYLKMNKTNTELLATGDPRIIATRIPDGDDCEEYIPTKEYESGIRAFWDMIKEVMDTNQRIVVEDYIKESIEQRYDKIKNASEKTENKNS